MARLSLRSIKAEATALSLSKEQYTTFYVGYGLSPLDDNDGLTRETSFATIQHAIDEGESGLTVYINDGTYPENITNSKDSVHLFGEDRTNAIVRPASGHSFYNTGDAFQLENLKIYSSDVPAVDPYTAAIKAFGCEYLAIRKCMILGESSVQSYGIHPLGCSRALIEDNVFSNPALHGIVIAPSAGINSYYNIIRNNQMESNGLRTAIKLITSSYYTQIYGNDIRNYGLGVNCYWLAAGSQHSSIYHNNFESNIIDLENTGALANKWYENYYDSHTTDTNNDGICDTPYTFTTGTDYAPVSKRNGWLQESLGLTSSSSITTTNTFNLVNALLTLTETGGTITTDGTEQVIYINDAPAGVFAPKKLQLDFTNQTAGEVLVVREYYRIKTGGTLIKKHEVTFTGVQNPLLKNVALEPNRFGVKITIEKTVGTNRDYDWGVQYKI